MTLGIITHNYTTLTEKLVSLLLTLKPYKQSFLSCDHTHTVPPPTLDTVRLDTHFPHDRHAHTCGHMMYVWLHMAVGMATRCNHHGDKYVCTCVPHTVEVYHKELHTTHPSSDREC